MASQKYALKMLGSSVPPDLLLTMQSVFERSTRACSAAICAGSVLSSTSSSGKPACRPNVSASTSGPRLEPPMPSSSTCWKPSALISSWNACSAGRSAERSSITRSQPSHFASSAPLHRLASCAQRSRTLPCLRQSSITAFTSPASGSGRLACMVLSLSPSMAARFAATDPSSLSAAAANSSTPSTTSALVTSSSPSPCSSAAAMTARAPSRSSVRLARGCPWSRNASMVAGGMVSTVSGPISSSTYSTSL